jgi:intracellular multiplication protein IcmK
MPKLIKKQDKCPLNVLRKGKSLKRFLGICISAALIVNLGLSDSYAQAAAKSDSSDSDSAFNQLLKNSFPLTPTQIHTFKDRSAEQQQASARPIGNAPLEGTSNMISVSLKPGATMPLVKVGQGQISSLVFTDSTNKVWPIDSYSIGDSKTFHVMGSKKSGILMVQSSKLYGDTNMAVILKGLQVPVTLHLIVGGSTKSYDFMDYIQVPGFQSGDSGTSGGSGLLPAPKYLTDVLQDTPPKGAKLLETNSDLAKVWRYGNQYLLLTRATLLSPSYKARKNSPMLAGSSVYHAYEIKPTPVIMLSANGKQQTINVTDNTLSNSSDDDNGLNSNILGGTA